MVDIILFCHMFHFQRVSLCAIFYFGRKRTGDNASI
jgi:hypothetical protein